MGVHLMGVHLTGMHLIYESSLRAGHGWRESLYRHPGWFKKLLIVGDSAVRLLVTLGARSAYKAKAAALYAKWYQSSLSKLSTQEVGEAGERSAGNRIG